MLARDGYGSIFDQFQVDSDPDSFLKGGSKSRSEIASPIFQDFDLDLGSGLGSKRIKAYICVFN